MRKMSLLIFALAGPPSIAAGVFRFSENGSLASLDPAHATTVYESTVLRSIYDTLYTYKYLKRPYELRPLLAEEMPQVSKDGLTYKIRLKKGIRFSDAPCFPDGRGREITSPDFIYSLQRHFSPEARSRNAWLWSDRIVGTGRGKPSHEGLRALDDHTIQVKLTRPYPQFVHTLAMIPSAIVPKECVERLGVSFRTTPIGSGPYRLDSRDSRKVVLRRNENYRHETFDLRAEGYEKTVHAQFELESLEGKKLPILDRVEIHFMNEPTARWSSFTKGNEIDFTIIPNAMVEKLLERRVPPTLKEGYSKKYFSLAQREHGLVLVNFNLDDPRIGNHPDPKVATRNRALRCAIRKAFDWPERVGRFYYGMGEAFPGIVPPGYEGYDPELSRESVTPDFEAARKSLSSAGWTVDSLPVLEVGAPASALNDQLFEQFRGWLKKAGYPPEKIKRLNFAGFADYNQAVKERKVMIHSLGWQMDYPDPENLFQLFYGPNSSPGSNSSNFKNPLYDKLYHESSVLPPGPARHSLFKQLNRLLIDECVTIAGYSRTELAVWHRRVLMVPDRNFLGGIFFKFVGLK